MTEELPTRRYDLAGTDLDGRAVRVSLGLSRQLYRCPGCRDSLQIGAEHIILVLEEPDGARYHQHWHTACVASILRELQGVRRLAR